MFLFVGLGNYGSEYKDTRHNVGFIIAEKFIKEFGFNSQGKKFHSEVWSGTINCSKVVLIKPQTYMNRSGIAVSETAHFFKISPENVFVFHDDMDLDIGKVKFKVGGGDAGHNGIKSIDSMIGKNYNRVRIGIGKPQYKGDATNFVVGNFSEDERVAIENICDKIVTYGNLLLHNRELFLTNILKK